MISFEIAVIVSLITALVTGLRTMHRHRSFFCQFGTRELIGLRLDALLYLLLSGSTAFCLTDVFLRTLWIFEFGWSPAYNRWAALWLGIHCAFAATTTLLHLLIGRLLGNDEFCELCRREL